MGSPGVVENIARELGLRVVRGELRSGDKLPSVRALASEFEVNVSTVQRVLVQLEERGLVEARPRSGVVVQDVERLGVSNVWPLVMSDAQRQRERATELLRDGLRCRRVLAIDVLADWLAAKDDAALDALERQVDAFEKAVVVLAGPDLAQSVSDTEALLVIFEAESSVLRTLLATVRRPAVLAVLNEVQRMLRANAELLAVIYARPAETVAMWRALVAVLRSGDAPLAPLEQALTQFDQQIVQAFSARLGE